MSRLLSLARGRPPRDTANDYTGDRKIECVALGEWMAYLAGHRGCVLLLVCGPN
jgi:hypothetical protein